MRFDINGNNIFPAQAVDGNAAEGGFGSWQCLPDAPFRDRLHVLSERYLLCRIESNDVIIFENAAVTLLSFLVIPRLAPEACRFGSFQRRLGHYCIKGPLKERCHPPSSFSSRDPREYLHQEAQAVHATSTPSRFAYLSLFLVDPLMSDSLQIVIDAMVEGI